MTLPIQALSLVRPLTHVQCACSIASTVLACLALHCASSPAALPQSNQALYSSAATRRIQAILAARPALTSSTPLNRRPHLSRPADSALGGSGGDINHLLQYLGHPQYQLPGAYAPARNPNLIPASRYPSSHPLLSPMDPLPTPSSVASMLGSCGLDGPHTPPQAMSPADDLLWQYRAHMPALSAPSSGFHLGSRQVSSPRAWQLLAVLPSLRRCRRRHTAAPRHAPLPVAGRDAGP